VHALSRPGQAAPWAAEAADAVHLSRTCGADGLGAQYLYIVQGVQWDCYTDQTYYRVAPLYRAPCLCVAEAVAPPALLGLEGVGVGAAAVAAVWALGSAQRGARYAASGLDGLLEGSGLARCCGCGWSSGGMTVGVAVRDAAVAGLAVLSLVDIVTDVLVALLFLRTEQWGLLAAALLILGVAWGFMLRNMAHDQQEMAEAAGEGGGGGGGGGRGGTPLTARRHRPKRSNYEIEATARDPTTAPPRTVAISRRGVITTSRLDRLTRLDGGFRVSDARLALEASDGDVGRAEALLLSKRASGELPPLQSQLSLREAVRRLLYVPGEEGKAGAAARRSWLMLLSLNFRLTLAR